MKYLIALLTAATGILHLVVGFGIGGGGAINWLLVLNGVGYLVLLVLFWMASGNGGIIRWILLAYTLITLIGYFAIQAGNNFGFDNTMGLIIKAIELLLVILLLLYRAPQKVVASRPATTPTRMGAGIDTTRTAGQALGTTAATAAAGTSTAAAATAAAAVSMADRSGEVIVDTADHAVDEVDDAYATAADLADDATDAADDALDAVADTAGDAVDYVGDKAEDAYDATADFVDDAADAAGDTAEAAADTAGDAVDYVGDKAEDAYDATADFVDDAADAAGDTADAVADTAGDAVDYVGDKAEDAYDATADFVGDAADAAGDTADAVVDTAGDAMDAVGEATSDSYDASLDMTRGAAVAGAGLVGAAAYDSPEDRTGMATDLDAAQLAAEPTADEIRTELEEYLRSFGPSSEFRKPIEYVEGIGAVYGQKLRAMGINTVLDMVANGATRRGRKHIADQTGIAQSLILTWVNHVDLFRIKGVAEEYADLLEQSGVDTVVELAQRNPANLYKRMKDINEQKELVRRIPHASEVESWVQQAKSLRRLIHY